MKVLSLFSGAGGFDMGLEQAGMEVVYQCEIEKKCQLVLKHHWPNVPVHDDVSTLTGKMVLDAVGSIDVVAWGSPCQDLSIAGGRSGLEGNRSGLFYEGIRIIKELREESNNAYPRWSIWENVRGAFSSNHGRDFATVIDQMGEAGAVEIEWRLLDAQYFGVPQRRKRIFIVAGFNPRADNADPVFALTESVRRDSSTSAKEREEIAGTLGKGSGTRSGQEEAAAGLMVAVSVEQMTFIPPIASAVCARYRHGPDSDCSDGQVVVTPQIDSTIDQSQTTFIPKIAGTVCARYSKGPNQSIADGQIVVVPQTYPTLTAGLGHSYCQNNQDVDGGYLLVTPIGNTTGSTNGFGVGKPGDPSPTLTQSDRHAVFVENEQDIAITPISFDSNWSGHYDVTDSGLSPTIKSTQSPPAVAFDEYNFSTDDTHHSLRAGGKQSTGVVEMAVRRLTPRECERLMGWPDDHTLLGSDGKEITDGHRYKMCGNGVVSSVAKWVGEQVMRADEEATQPEMGLF